MFRMFTTVQIFPANAKRLNTLCYMISKLLSLIWILHVILPRRVWRQCGLGCWQWGEGAMGLSKPHTKIKINSRHNIDSPKTNWKCGWEIAIFINDRCDMLWVKLNYFLMLKAYFCDPALHCMKLIALLKLQPEFHTATHWDLNKWLSEILRKQTTLKCRITKMHGHKVFSNYADKIMQFIKSNLSQQLPQGDGRFQIPLKV
jgi:hypothetical protein